MNKQGELIKKLDIQTGQGSNGEWRRQTIVIRTEDQYPKEIAIDGWNDKVDIIAGLNIGDKLKVNGNIESKEYNGKYFTNIGLWKVEVIQAAVQSNPFPLPNNQANEPAF